MYIVHRSSVFCQARTASVLVPTERGRALKDPARKRGIRDPHAGPSNRTRRRASQYNGREQGYPSGPAGFLSASSTRYPRGKGRRFRPDGYGPGKCYAHSSAGQSSQFSADGPPPQTKSRKKSRSLQAAGRQTLKRNAPCMLNRREQGAMRLVTPTGHSDAAAVMRSCRNFH